MFTVYSTGCPKCKVLLTKLKQKNQLPDKDFTLVEDNDEILRVAKTYNVQSAPFIVDNENVYLFADAVKFVNRIGA